MNQINQSERICDKPDCQEAGIYPAPFSPQDILTYRWLCLKHVRAYNRNWNYYKDRPLSVLEHDIRARLFGDNPIWSFAHASTGLFAERAESPPKDQKPSSMLFYPRSREQREALMILKLSPPTTRQDISTRYKQIAKQLHPDANFGQSQQERSYRKERLQEASQAYAILKQALSS